MNKRAAQRIADFVSQQQKEFGLSNKQIAETLGFPPGYMSLLRSSPENLPDKTLSLLEEWRDSEMTLEGFTESLNKTPIEAVRETLEKAGMETEPIPAPVPAEIPAPKRRGRKPKAEAKPKRPYKKREPKAPETVFEAKDIPPEQTSPEQTMPEPDNSTVEKSGPGISMSKLPPEPDVMNTQEEDPGPIQAFAGVRHLTPEEMAGIKRDLNSQPLQFFPSGPAPIHQKVCIDLELCITVKTN